MPHRKKPKPPPQDRSSDSDHEKDKALFENLSLGSRGNKTFSFEDILSQHSHSHHSQNFEDSRGTSLCPCSEANCSCDNASLKSFRVRK